ncbi:unnamed protein product [Rotaria sp. Silwood2]|nr:unnamed protein product [Rotaria sp. Silwood2]CAF2617634.1 unnamed protein product [Rotaria sp. Silwood2]CAF2854439.1 unnamed protein product [Rotaria sp. Silwood2]CAF3011737.1 unnamed protein product [Rotaria sp. Silwood2]CAF3883624.1 unnamed protein product [Rotaria sp. Silwood2]
MSYGTSSGYFSWTEEVPISFTEWKTILSKLTKEEIKKRLSTNSESHRLSTSRQYSPTTKKNERQSQPRNSVFGDPVIDSFLVSSSSNLAQSSTNISQQDVSKRVSSSTKRYVSSFKTLVNSTSGKHTRRLSYVNDSVIIVKLTKENATENNGGISQSSNKNSTLPMTTSTTITTPSRKQSYFSPSRLSPVLKLEAQKRRIAHHDSSSIASTNNYLTISSNLTNSMAMSTTSHTQSNPSLFTYRNTLAGGNTIRQRALAETPTNNLLITTERIKSNISSAMRPTRQPLTTTATTTTMASTYTSSQQSQRNVSQNTRSRIQQDKSMNSKEIYEYPDPFTNCPQDFLSKLAQLTKLQLETIEWEKKRRFTKKKPIPNGIIQGKDSP